MSKVEVKQKATSKWVCGGVNEHQRRTAGHFWQRPITNVAVLALLLACLPLALTSGFHYHLAVLVGINATIAISLNLLMGYAGQVSLGHAGFVALGAYGTAILSSRYGWPVPLALVSSAAGAALIAFVVGRPILRLKGYYLALGTLGLGMIIYLVISNEVWLTGGPDGMPVPVLELFGGRLTGPADWYWLIAVMLLLVFWLSTNLIHAPLGRALRALEGPEAVAGSVGIDVPRSKLLVFTLSAAIAALMGGFLALYAGFISPSLADFLHSIELALMVLVGGLGSVVGSIIGAALITLLPQVLTVVEEYETLVYGLILIGVMMFMPRGLLSSIIDLWRRIKR
ncbi:MULTISPECIES: branched-chain amino acid ABC transporter permease [Marinobacter]|jgi:branched-chain amino acid transport system permease protein|uniref:branched-chain amino acid ABC transporter permease n=1 Tax=Marinobacter TaxID=2742 RepID=UPI000AC33EE3|nr:MULTISPECIES: branched-chain amino acid ABC transporter permease [unclassified Marinobacter]